MDFYVDLIAHGQVRRGLGGLARKLVSNPTDFDAADHLVRFGDRVGRLDWVDSFVTALERRFPTAAINLAQAELHYSRGEYPLGLGYARRSSRARPDAAKPRLAVAAGLAGMGRVLEAIGLSMLPPAAGSAGKLRLAPTDLGRRAVLDAVLDPKTRGRRASLEWLTVARRRGDLHALARATVFSNAIERSLGADVADVHTRRGHVLAVAGGDVETAVLSAIDSDGNFLVEPSRAELSCALLTARARRNDCMIAALETAWRSGDGAVGLSLYRSIRNQLGDHPVAAARLAAAAVPMLASLGELAEASELAQIGSEAARRLRDDELRATFLARLSWSHRQAGNVADALAAARAARAFVPVEAVGLRLRVLVELWDAASAAGDTQVAEEAVAEALGLERIPGDDLADTGIAVLAIRLRLAAHPFLEATASLSFRHEPLATVAAPERSPDPVTAAAIHAVAFESRGRIDEALLAYETALEELHRFRSGFVDAYVRSQLSSAWRDLSRRAIGAAMAAGRIDKALAFLEIGRSWDRGSPTRKRHYDFRSDVVVLSYAIDRNFVWVAAARSGRTTEFRLGRLDRLRNLAGLWRSSSASREGASTWFELGTALGQELIAPVLATGLLSGAKVVYVVPDGFLHAVPFGALPLPDTDQLFGDRFLVAHAPSLAALDESMAQELTPGETVAFGPHGGTDTLIEIRAAAGAEGTALWGARATETRWKALGPRAKIVHFAGHTERPTADRPLSLRLTGDAREDGHLTIDEITRLRFDGATVVLMGCDTAARVSPDSVTGYASEFPSLAEAFLMAGARAVVGPARTITEQAARELAIEFYRAGGPQGGAASLREAQAVLRERWPDSPERWAGIVWYGNAEPAVGLSGLESGF